jgi:acetyl esterase/lipase
VSSVLYADPYWVSVRGLPAGETVTIRSRLWGYRGFADFVVGVDGTVDCSRDAPVAGTYAGIDPEGLLWSMRAEEAMRESDFDVHYSVELGGEELARATIVRTPLGLDMNVIDVRKAGVVGTLFWRDTGHQSPAVILLGGSEGGLESTQLTAAWLAEHGYVALSLGYFGAEGLPPTLDGIRVELVREALSWLAERAEVDDTRFAVMGTSRGSELALEAAARFREIRAVVAVAPSAVRWPGIGGTAWTFGGEPLGYLSSDARAPTRTLADGRVVVHAAPVFRDAVAAASPMELDGASVHVEDAVAAVLFLGGDADAIWPSCDLARIGLDRLASSGHAASHPDRLVCVEGAGHSLGIPGWPTGEFDVSRGLPGGTLLWLGGGAEGIARGRRAFREEVLSFLEQVLG